MAHADDSVATAAVLDDDVARLRDARTGDLQTDVAGLELRSRRPDRGGRPKPSLKVRVVVIGPTVLSSEPPKVTVEADARRGRRDGQVGRRRPKRR